MHRSVLTGALIVLAATANVAAQIPPTMTVQGRLTDAAGNPVAPGPKTFTFRIFDAPTSGNEIWPGGSGEVHVLSTDSDGLWTATVGSITPFSGALFFLVGSSWLEVTVDNGVDPPETLPRIRLLTSPYAFNAESAITAHSAVPSSITSVAIVDATIEFGDIGPNGALPGQVMKFNGSAWVAADDATGGAGSSGWVDDGTVVRLETGSDSVGIGTASPSAKLEVTGDVRVGGKATIGPGHTNTGQDAFVAGRTNSATGNAATIGGGADNQSSNDQTTVAGGRFNAATGISATVGGGFENAASGTDATVAGGYADTAGGFRATVSGSARNTESGATATIGGGWSNRASGVESTIGGGGTNRANGGGATISGGYENTASGLVSTIAGGQSNTASGGGATIGGGAGNVADSAAFVGGGFFNYARGVYSVVAGGGGPNPGDSNSAIGGGFRNTATGGGATVAGGNNNIAAVQGAAVGGGATTSRGEGTR